MRKEFCFEWDSKKWFLVLSSWFMVRQSRLGLTHSLVGGAPCGELFQFYCMVRGSKFEVRSFAMREARFFLGIEIRVKVRSSRFDVRSFAMRIARLFFNRNKGYERILF